jgi:acyl dehydratase
MSPAPLAYTVEAYNTAKEHENKIHDDAVARRFGFAGGLVPGVEVYGYMTHLPVARWGRAWLERGAAECRFTQPIYEGDIVSVRGAEGADRLELTVESRGAVCAGGWAALPRDAVAPPALAGFPPVPERASRAAADEDSLTPDTRLGIEPLHVTAELAAAHLAGVRETATLYAEAGLVHPAVVLRVCNLALTRNVVLGPWIHVGSNVQNLAAARVGDTLGIRARVSANYQRKGHRFVELDALVVANGVTPIAWISHVAIYRPRQLAV